jgi:hypothetical protein
MKHLLSIFSFKTVQFRLRITGSILICVCALIAAEAVARLAVHRGVLQEMPTLKKLVHENLQAADERRSDVWIFGNSALEFGIDEDYLNGSCHVSAMKFCHGGATLSGSVAMLDFYLKATDHTPRHIVLVVTKDDFNSNGLNERTSEKYLEFMTWRKYFRIYSFLRAVRGSLYDAAVRLYGRMFISQKNRHDWYRKESFLKIDIDLENVTRLMMEDYSYTSEGFRLLADISRTQTLPGVTVVLLPITRKYLKWHDREYPDMSYDAIRSRIKTDCEQRGFGFIDLGEPPEEHGLFSDYFHLNKQGCAYLTPIICSEIKTLLGVR